MLFIYLIIAETKINTNLSSLIVQSGLKNSTNGLNQVIERMTTGFKINHAKDNAANYSISTKLSSKISGYQSVNGVRPSSNSKLKLRMVLMGINLLSSSGESVASSGQFIEEITRRDTSGMTTLASVEELISLTSGTYSISTAEELSKLAAMTNNGLIGENTEFVLANDIDLSAYSTGKGWMPIGTP